jgi:hypothetical protein
MAFFDVPGQNYDGGIFYDSGPLPQPFVRMAKKKVKLNLKDKSDTDLLSFAQQHEAAMTGNANFTTLLPAATAFTPVRAAYATTLGNCITAQQAAKLATQQKDTARDALESMLVQRGNYVELTAASAADPVAVIESAGFSSKSASVPTGVPDMVQSLALTAGDNAGEIDAQWDPVKGTKIHYDLQWSASPATESSWKDLPATTKSKSVLGSFTSGQLILIRVRASGAGGIGAWSQTAAKVAP